MKFLVYERIGVGEAGVTVLSRDKTEASLEDIGGGGDCNAARWVANVLKE